MIRKSKHILYAITAVFIMVLLNSCETTEKIEDFPLRPSRLVANCYFAPDSIWTFQISKSLSVLDNAGLELVKNAKIVISEDSEVLDTIIAPDADLLYRSDAVLPVAGHTYSVEVISPEYKTSLYAEDKLPDAVKISNVTISIVDSSFYYDPYIEYSYGNVNGIFDISFKDPGDQENFYQLSVYSYFYYYDYWDSTYFIERRPVSFTTEDPVAENDDSYGNVLLFSDEIINGQNYKLRLDFEDWDASKESKYEIEMISLSRAGYLYRRTVEEYQESSEDPFSEPVLIYSNIENGYGIFAGYSTEMYTVRLFD